MDEERNQLNHSPDKPILIFDGDCPFCIRWMSRWKHWLDDQIEFLPIREAAVRFPQLSIKSLQDAVRFVETDGSIYSGAHAVYRSLAKTQSPFWKGVLWCYQTLPGFAPLCEWGYQFIARNRRRRPGSCNAK